MDNIAQSSAGGVLSRDNLNRAGEVSSIEGIKFEFDDEMVSIEITIKSDLDSSFSSFTTSEYTISDPNFLSSLNSELNLRNLTVMDIQAVTNLLHIKAISHLLSSSIKRILISIENFTAIKIYEDLQRSSSATWESATAIAKQTAEAIGMEIASNHEKIVNINRVFGMEVFEREEVINITHKQLLDNLRRKHFLVVNQLKEAILKNPAILQMAEDPLVAQVSQFIHNL
jgi:hypothetical protein